MSQNDLIVQHIRKAGGISRREAMIDYSIQNLTARVNELRQQGYKIKTKMKHHPVTGQSYARYTF